MASILICIQRKKKTTRNISSNSNTLLKRCIYRVPLLFIISYQEKKTKQTNKKKTSRHISLLLSKSKANSKLKIILKIFRRSFRRRGEEGIQTNEVKFLFHDLSNTSSLNKLRIHNFSAFGIHVNDKDKIIYARLRHLTL